MSNSQATSQISTSGLSAELASGGGNATAAGVAFQGCLGATFVTAGLAARPLDPRLGLDHATVKSIRFESESPIDDLLVETSDQGYVFVQAKTTLSLSSSLDSELGKTAEQFIRQWQLCFTGDGTKGWNRKLNPLTDRFVIAVSATTPNTIGTDLSQALVRRRTTAIADVSPQNQLDALEKFETLLKAAWLKVYGAVADNTDISKLLDLTAILRFDFGGSDLVASSEMLRSELQNQDAALSAFKSLTAVCVNHMSARTGATTAQLRRQLEQSGVGLLAPPSYRSDVEAFRQFSQRTLANLASLQSVQLDKQTSIHVERPVVLAAVRALAGGPLLLTGEPGAGKSGVLQSVGASLSRSGKSVLYIAVDRLPVAGMDGLRTEIGLAHPIREVLENWPSAGIGLLLIDGLDAVRGGSGEAVFKTLIADVLTLPSQNWSVVASVRSFDLRLGQQFRTLFRGISTELAFLDKQFSDVRHVDVRPWGQAELDELLSQAPALKTALESSGKNLRDLAMVPFNTQLLADLVGAGVEPSALGSIATQAELLKAYWSHRVQQFGVSADACIASILREMIDERALRAKQDSSRASHPLALEQLLTAGVLVSQSGERYLAFRHNILFDYAASRLYLNPYDTEHLKAAFARSNGAGLVLAPALGYALQELWASDVDRSQFWNVASELLKDKSIDPIARSVAARSACELPMDSTDVEELSQVLVVGTDSGSVFSSIAGALAIKLEDNPASIRVEVWSQMIVRLSELSQFNGAISFLMSLFLKLDGAVANQHLGVAARNLLKSAFETPAAEYSKNFTHTSIDYVAKTFGTETTESRTLLGSVFDTNRLALHAHVEVPALAAHASIIAPFDPAFAASFYSGAFSHKVTSREQTSISGSPIMALTSNESQDYDMARWQLAQYYPRFLDEHATDAANAIIAALEGYVASEHPLKEVHREWKLNVGGSTVTLVEDYCRYWAWDVMDSHPDNLQTICQAFVIWLRKAPKAEALAVSGVIQEKNRLALLWARLLMVASERPSIFSEELWDFVTNEHVLLCSDTKKDAIDAVAAFFPFRSESDRALFEESIEKFDFSVFVDPEKARELFMRSLFQSIDPSLLSTEAAKFHASHNDDEAQVPNERPFVLHSSVSTVDDNWWLKEQGVALDSPLHASLLAKGNEFVAAIGLQSGQSNQKVNDVPAAIQQFFELMDALEAGEAGGADKQIIRRIEGNLSDGCSAILGSVTDASPLESSQLNRLQEIVFRLSKSEFPVVEDGQEEAFERFQSWGSPAARVDSVNNLYRLCQVRPAEAAILLSRLDELKTDSHPAVRATVAQHISVLWNVDKPGMWELAEHFATHEGNQGVLLSFAHSFLGTLRNSDPTRVESMVLQLDSRFPADPSTQDANARRPIGESIAALTAMLYVWNDRTGAGKLVLGWAEAPAINEDHIRSALFAVRQAMTSGYDNDSPEDGAFRNRSQEFLRTVVLSSANGLSDYYQATAESRESRKEEAVALAKCLDNACNALYFGSGAFGEKMGPESSLVTSAKGKAKFLSEVQDLLRRMGDVGTPHTIYQLLQLLEFTLASEPGLSFDLLSHAMLNGGRKQGYQLDYMGAEIFVRIVARCLADYREIFRDPARRDALVDCLDLFIEAGWPSARRLLYRLPEALQ